MGMVQLSQFPLWCTMLCSTFLELVWPPLLSAHLEHQNGSRSDTSTVDIFALHSVRQDSVGPRLSLQASIDAAGRRVG